MTGWQEARYADGHAWARASEAVLGRIGRNDELEQLHAQVVSKLYLAERRYAEALPEAQRAVELATRVFGPDHPRTADALTQAGVVYRALGRALDARNEFDAALAAYRRALGPNHPRLIEALIYLSGLTVTLGKAEEGLAYAQQAASLAERTLGKEHPYYAMAAGTVGGMLIMVGRYEEAVPYEKAAVSAYERVAPKHPNAALCLVNWGDAQAHLGRFKEATYLCERSRPIIVAAHGPGSSELMGVLTCLGQVLLGQKRYPEATAALQRAIKLGLADTWITQLELAEPRFALAQALWEVPGSRSQALELAREARAAFADTRSTLAAVAQMDAWLAARRQAGPGAL